MTSIAIGFAFDVGGIVAEGVEGEDWNEVNWKPASYVVFSYHFEVIDLSIMIGVFVTLKKVKSQIQPKEHLYDEVENAKEDYVCGSLESCVVDRGHTGVAD